MTATNVAPRSTQTATRAGMYRVDPAHTVVEFSVKHMMFATVKGHFSDVSGEILFDEADPTRSWVVASASAASVDTGQAQRDAHLRSADFFDVERFPSITFQSQRVELADGDDRYRVVGDLTIHGVAREVVFEATYLGHGADPWGGTRIGISATATINRKDFGLEWNMALETGGVLVADWVRINLEVEAVKVS